MVEGGQSLQEEKRQPKSPLIVGVGASASALSSIERFFSKFTLDPEQAIVLVLRHREALKEGSLTGTFERLDGARIFEISDGMEINGGTIYLCPVNTITTIQGHKFAVRPAQQALGERATIDSFLVSLAEQRAEQSIGVLLSGIDGDGTLGVATLKDHGGLAIAESIPHETSEQPAVIADFVLPPEEIPEHIQVYARHLRRLEERHGFDEVLEAASESLSRIADILRNKTGNDFQGYKQNTLMRHVQRRMQVVQIDDIAAYVDFLRSDKDEAQQLFNELFFGVVQDLTRATSDLKNFVESTQIATVFLDNDLRVMNFTPAITDVLHLVETDIGRPIAQIKARIPTKELVDDVRQVLRTLASSERDLTAPDSGTRYFVRILPYRSIDDFIAGVVVTFVDVTAITRAEERQRLLLAELQHRVRNTLSVVRSIARRSAETSTSVEEYASHLDGRLNAFARTQAAVTRDPENGVDLEYLIVEELLVYNVREGEQLRISGPTVRLQPKAAETFALAIHELATNAIKYGALSQPTGQINISWRVDNAAEAAQLIFDWREKGGPSVTPPERKGFGSELLERTIAFELKGRTTLAFDPAGFSCTISVPMTRRVVHASVAGI
jgi:two-component sensor histidine kinase